MTLLGRNDSDDASYLEIAEYLSSYSAPEHLEAVLSTASYYRLTKRRAVRIVDRIRKTVSGWEAVARTNGLSSRECAEAKHLFVGIE